MRASWASIAVALGVLAAGCEDRGSAEAGREVVVQSASSGPVSVRMSLERDHLTTAEHVGMTLEVTAPAGTAASPPDLAPELGGFTVIEQRRDGPRLVMGGSVARSSTYTLAPFLPGDYTIPSIEVAYTDRTGASGVVSTKPVKVAVASVLGAEEQESAEIGPARDVVDPSPAVVSRGIAAAIAMGVAIAAIGVGFVVWWLNRRRARTAPDPCLIAERRLGALQDQPLAGPAAARAAVEEASALLRTCLAHRVDPSAATRTTDELLLTPAIARMLSEHDMGVLRAGLAQSDAAKFAGALVSESEARAMMAETLGLIRTLSSLVVVPPVETRGTGSSASSSEGLPR